MPLNQVLRWYGIAGQVLRWYGIAGQVHVKPTSRSCAAVDYPCSLQKEFDTVCSLTKALLQRLEGSEVPIASKYAHQ
jgi:hypothetical protein